MRRSSFARFCSDEQGVAAIWSLFWFLIFCAFAGLAIDGTDGLRSRTMLQATADAAALAGVIDLPDEGEARLTAVLYAQANMAPQVYGMVLDVRDVHVGKWDPDTRTVDTAAASPDTVLVTTRRSEDNVNPLPVTFLKLFGFDAWNVQAQAAAQRYIPECLREGLISRKMVNMSSNNHFTKEICVHGQLGQNIQSNNTFDPGVTVGMYDMDTLELPASGFDTNGGLYDALREQSLDPRMVDHIDEIIQGVLDLNPAYTPSYIDISKPVLETKPNFNFNDMQPHRVYYVQCKPNQNLVIPANSVIQHVALIADCQITIGAHAQIFSAFIASRSGGRNNGTGELNRGDANITTAAGVQLGTPDNCGAGGGVQLFSNATIGTSSSTKIDGVQIVAKGEVALGAETEGINGISVQAGGDIDLASNNMFGLCQGAVPDLFTVWYYRLVL